MRSRDDRITQIRWHGRGGQGAITAARVVAVAAFSSGYRGTVMVPTFGTERRGAPVTTSLKISRSKIYDLSPIKSPEIVVVLDHLILDEVDVVAGLKPGGLIILNSPYALKDYCFPGFKIAVVNVTKLALEAGLRKGVVNTGIIGAFGRATGLVDIDILASSIEKEFAGRKPQANAEAARLVYAATQVDETVVAGVGND